MSSEDPDSGAPAAIFPQYYPVHPALPFSGRKPTWAEAHAFATAAARAEKAPGAATAASAPAAAAVAAAASAAADPHVRSLVDIIPIPWSASDDDEGRPAYLLGGAYKRAAGEDMWTALAGFEAWMAEHTQPQGETATPASSVAPRLRLSPRGWLQLPMIGLGFFAQWRGRRNIADLLMPRLLEGLRWALEKGPAPAPASTPAVTLAHEAGAAAHQAVAVGGAGASEEGASAAFGPAAWRHLSVLELCDFSRSKTFTLTAPGSPEGTETHVAGVRVLHSVKRGLLDFTGLDADPASRDTASATAAASSEALAEAEAVGAYTPGMVNAGDCFAFPGNERGYGSVEAMLGENTSLRRNQVYLFNPWILDSACHVALHSPLA